MSIDFNINPLAETNIGDNLTKTKLDGIKSKLENDSSVRESKFKQIMSKIKDSASYGGKFEGKDKDLAPRNAQEKELLDTVTELESLMVNQMYKSMRSNINKENDLLYGGMTEDIFTDMLYNEYSLQTSRMSNLGLAKQMYKQMLPLLRNTVTMNNIDKEV